MRYLSLALLSPTLLVLIWLYWTFPKGAASWWRRVYDVVVVTVTLSACVFVAMQVDAAAVSTADAFGRQSGQIWSQVKPALCGYGVSTLLLGAGVLIRAALWCRPSARRAAS